MAFGLSILPEDGGKAIDITTSARIPSFLNYSRVTTNTVSGATPYTAPGLSAGASMFIVPAQAAVVYGNSTTPYPLLNVIDRIDISGASANIIIKSSNSNLPYANSFVKVNSYQIMGAGGNGYGLKLVDNTDFMTISDASKAGACVFRQKVTINGSWSIPSIPGRDSCLVCAYWNNGGVRVTYNSVNKVINVWGVNAAAASADLWITIFANNIALTPPKFGMAVYNAAGACTFTSKYAPLILRGSFTLNKTPGAAANTSGIDRPMVPLGLWGVWVFAGSFYEIFYAGMVMSGGTLSTASAGRVPGGSSMPNAGGNVTSMISTMSLPLLNARDYFDGL